jgi:hypothetical protein
MTALSESPNTSNFGIPDLIKMNRQELDDLFSKSAAGPIPEGESSGTAIVCPGTFWSGIIAKFVRRVAWQGKVFTKSPDGKDATLQNKIGPVSTELIVARVYYTPSWLDGKECIVLDYSKTSLFARKIRDEIREVAPRLYLGKVWWGKTRLIDFALEFRNEP